MKRKPIKKRSRPLIISHLNNIKRALLEGDLRPVFLEYLKTEQESRGLYALYDNKGRIYYFGKASELKSRLKNHLNDKHKDNWESMSLYFLSPNSNISELEGLVIASAKPHGNTQKPKIGIDKRRNLKKYLKDDALNQINDSVYPEKSKPKGKLFSKITTNKLKKLNQRDLAKSLCISQGRVSQLINRDQVNYKAIHNYIKESGKRNSILNLLDKRKL